MLLLVLTSPLLSSMPFFVCGRGARDMHVSESSRLLLETLAFLVSTFVRRHGTPERMGSTLAPICGQLRPFAGNLSNASRYLDQIILAKLSQLNDVNLMISAKRISAK